MDRIKRERSQNKAPKDANKKPRVVIRKWGLASRVEKTRVGAKKRSK